MKNQRVNKRKQWGKTKMTMNNYLGGDYYSSDQSEGYTSQNYTPIKSISLAEEQQKDKTKKREEKISEENNNPWPRYDLGWDLGNKCDCVENIK